MNKINYCNISYMALFIWIVLSIITISFACFGVKVYALIPVMIIGMIAVMINFGFAATYDTIYKKD